MVKRYLISDRFSFLDRFFPRCFDNSVRAFHSFCSELNGHKMSLYCYYRKMVEIKYRKVQIHVLTDFNHNLNLIHYLSHNFQGYLGKLKVKSLEGHQNGSGGISNKTVSDKFLSLLCYLLQYENIVCSSSYLSVFISSFFTLQRTQCWNITQINHIPTN